MLLKYSNGWGHLIMSLVTMAAGMYLVVSGSQPGLGITLVGLVTSAWFIPGAAKQVSNEIKQDAVPTIAQNVAQVVAKSTGPLPIVLDKKDAGSV